MIIPLPADASTEQRLTMLCTLVSEMHERLLGNGQPGWCESRLTRLVAVEKEQERVSDTIKAIGPTIDRVTALEHSHSQTRGAIGVLAWITGIFATASSAVVAVFLRRG